MPCPTRGFHHRPTAKRTHNRLSKQRSWHTCCVQRERDFVLLTLTPKETLTHPAAVANLERYSELLPDYPMIFAVENARQTATLTLKLAVAGGVKLTYDETNTYRADGTPVNPPDEFWSAVKMTDLTSVHFKQKNGGGRVVRSRRRFC